MRTDLVGLVRLLTVVLRRTVMEEAARHHVQVDRVEQCVEAERWMHPRLHFVLRHRFAQMVSEPLSVVVWLRRSP